MQAQCKLILILCLYDPAVYKYGNRNKKIIEIENTTDIDILNSFQISNATLNIGFCCPDSASDIRQLYKRYGTRKIHHCETSVTSRDYDRTRTITVRRQLELRHMPSFVHVRKSSRKKTDIALRNPHLAQAYYELERETQH